MLDIIEELGISDFPVSVRVNGGTPRKLLDTVARVMRHGGGVVAVYNESLVLDAMQKAYGYSLAEARRFANDGCWEVQIPGKTFFAYSSVDSLRVLLDDTLGLNGTPVTYSGMDELYTAYYA